MSGEKNRKTDIVEILGSGFDKIGAWSYDHRWIVLAMCVAVLTVSGFFAYKVRPDNSFVAYFDRSDPTYQEFLQFRDDFGSDEISYILYEAPDYPHGVWNLEIMRKIQGLTNALEDEVPFVDKVTSLANAEFIEGKDDELLVYDVLEDFPETQEELLEISKKVMKKPFFVDGLISKDKKYAALIMEMEKSSIDPLDEIVLDPKKGYALNNLFPQVSHNKIEEILDRPEYKGIKFYHTGDVPLNACYNQISIGESKKLGKISFLVIGLVLVFFFRRAMGVVGPLAVVLLSLLLVIGFMGVMGWNIDLMFTMLPAILIAVGVADAVHMFAEFRTYHVEFNDRRKAIKKTMYLVGVPCLFTSLTTMAGFASMSISPIKAIRHFAIYSAFGIFAAFILSVTFLPVILSFGRRTPKKDFTRAQKASAKGGYLFKYAFDGISRFNIQYKWLIVAVSVAIFVFFAIGVTKIKVDSSFMNEFSKEVEIRRVTEFADSVMGGTAGFSYVFESDKESGIIEPDVLKEIEALQAHAETLEVVVKTNSIVDVLKDLNRAFHNENDDFYVLPESRELAAQYLLLYESSGGDEAYSYITEDYQTANLELRCKMVPTSNYKDLVIRLAQFSESRISPVPEPNYTGMGSLWVKLLEYIVQSQIRGFALAFTVIAIMMCLVFGSIRTGLLAMVPNLSPVVVTLGYMGWAGIHLDYIKLLIACIAIGIAVDDTVHLITRYRHEFFACRDYKKALFPSLRDVGRALFITTVVLVCGFLVSTFSVMDSLATFGTLVAATVIVALVADFFLLPALVLIIKPFGPGKE